jgi:hypothetical protein
MANCPDWQIRCLNNKAASLLHQLIDTVFQAAGEVALRKRRSQ